MQHTGTRRRVAARGGGRSLRRLWAADRWRGRGGRSGDGARTCAHTRIGERTATRATAPTVGLPMNWTGGQRSRLRIYPKDQHARGVVAPQLRPWRHLRGLDEANDAVRRSWDRSPGSGRHARGISRDLQHIQALTQWPSARIDRGIRRPAWRPRRWPSRVASG